MHGYMTTKSLGMPTRSIYIFLILRTDSQTFFSFADTEALVTAVHIHTAGKSQSGAFSQVHGGNHRNLLQEFDECLGSEPMSNVWGRNG